MRPTDRTKLGMFFSEQMCDYPGIYIVACYPVLGCIYIGMSNNILRRMREHLALDNDKLGSFLRNSYADSVGFRIDTFYCEDENQRRAIEEKLIRYFSPFLNTQHIQSQNLLPQNP